jgi:hypothetical protein
MDNRIRLLELQRRWTPPDGLDRSRPRPVRLTGAGKAVLRVAVALFVGALAAGIALEFVASREAEAQRLLQEQGVNTEGRITRLWRSRGEDKQPWVAYRFTAQGHVYERRAKAPLRIWRNLQVGSDLPVRYLPSNPVLNHPCDWQQKPMPAWIPYLVAAGLAVPGRLVMLGIRSQRRLLAEGRPAPALVTRHTQTQHGKTIHYEFPVLSGAIAKGRSGPTRKPPAPGATICVLYEPENPRRNAPYPLSLVKPAYLR